MASYLSMPSVILHRIIGAGVGARALGSTRLLLPFNQPTNKPNFTSCVVSSCWVKSFSQSHDDGSGGGDGVPPIKKGVIVDKSPVKVLCEEGKTYSWCSCGLSQKQPLCDGTHKKSSCGLKPVRFTAPKTKEYFLCNCKQTCKQPLCDGTHKKLK